MPKIKKPESRLKKLVKNKKLLGLVIVIAFIVVGGTILGLSNALVADDFVDISSPQCGNNGIIGARNQFGIVGLNGTYMNFGTNACVVEQTRLFSSYDLYVGANYPSGHCAGISAVDCGKKAAQHNLNLIKFLGLKPGRIWIDVETGPNIKWSSNTNDNNAFLLGLYAGMYESYKTIGYYSNQSMWQSITGGAALGGAGNWYATGRTNPTDALTYCNLTFGGAPTTYVQYVQNGNLDVNKLCALAGKNPAPTGGTKK